MENQNGYLEDFFRLFPSLYLYLDKKKSAPEAENEPPAKKAKTEDEKPTGWTSGSSIEPGKESAIEAEVRAAQERAKIPVEIRMKQFRDMLMEKEVCETCLVRGFCFVTV